MTMANEEARQRRIAHKLGYCVIKSRRRDPNDPGYMGYALIDGRNAVIEGMHPWPYSLSLVDLAKVLHELAEQASEAA